MSLRIASWNIEGKLTDTGQKKRGSVKQIITTIKQLDADVLVLLEAHGEASLENLEPSQQLIDMGYQLYNAPYEDDSHRRQDAFFPNSSLMLLSKLPVKQFEIIRLANSRNAFAATIQTKTDQSFRIIGLHLDDRSEITRLNQVNDLANIVGQSKLATVIVGDFNAMHGEDLWPAQLLRSKPMHWLANFILPNISLKAIEMARGETLKLLQSRTGLRDADTRHRPTTTPKMRDLDWMPSLRLIQIDHIFVSSRFEVKQFQIAPDGGADHRAIIANVVIKE